MMLNDCSTGQIVDSIRTERSDHINRFCSGFQVPELNFCSILRLEVEFLGLLTKFILFVVNKSARANIKDLNLNPKGAQYE